RPVSDLRTVPGPLRKLPLGLRDCFLQLAVSECANAKGVDRSAQNPKVRHFGHFRFREWC
ncbi:hypothetical protein, partial [Sphingobium lactosutens]|uniref:hypothetical protein n=1 Tax=Sphingobium lactosutens TaxID=522773 RepID=UPI001C4CDABF